jgi:hypothetical protein
MTLSDNMQALVELLTQATRMKKIHWVPQQDALFAQSFSAALGNGSVELLEDGTGTAFNLLVKNEEDGLLDETGFLSPVASHELAELGQAVRASVLKRDEGLANIIANLREKVSQR